VQASELSVRAPTPRDAAGIAELLNAHAAGTGRPADETAERVERWFELGAGEGVGMRATSRSDTWERAL